MTLKKFLPAALIALTPVIATSAFAASLTVGFSQIGSESGWRAAETANKSLYLTAVTSGSVHEGVVAGEWLAKNVGSKPCNVVELQGTVGASVATNRKKGFDDAIAKHSNIKMIRSQTGDFTRAKGK